MKVVVVGGGITGVSVAEWLRRDGHDVTIVDRVHPGDVTQSSYGNCGIVGRNSVVPVSTPGLFLQAPGMLRNPDTLLFLRWRYLPQLIPWLVRFLWNGRREKVYQIAKDLSSLVQDSNEQHFALAAGTAAERFLQRGTYVTLFRAREEFARNTFSNELRKKHGAVWEEWDRMAIDAYDPAISGAYIFATAMRDYVFVTSPSKYVTALADHFRQSGGNILCNEAVDIRQLKQSKAVVELTDGRRLETDRVVLAAGVWSGRFASRLGHQAAMESERGYHLMLRGASHMPPAVLNVPDTGLGVCPMEEGLCFGGAVDFGGVDGVPNERVFDAIRRQIRRVYPDLTWEGETKWMGQRPSTIDSLPLLGPSPKAPSIYFAFGGQHIGLTMGPRIGRTVADLISGKQTDINISPYRVNRFD
ncbi:FAD-binding oxidoreductase [Pelagibius sp. Alg239-R121]|uniref:NAD(P)/FAD-dependent oxidoreductase n=1 Tax=Pelagibius sp. Alg239-R121 TaxID=2993448 RepID=UPI0024A6CF0D|nr:FAD-dependent oxidoreductase [Pelagibius sp. Alg239-R121]